MGRWRSAKHVQAGGKGEQHEKKHGYQDITSLGFWLQSEDNKKQNTK